MWPLSLLFSSDEQTSHALSQALTELEFEVESCPEIFSAVEKITSRAFEVIVSDWNEGLEAVFLLKTSRELKANHAAFTIAIADSGAANAAREAGADLVLSRPLAADAVKYALLTCDEFLAHMKKWLPMAKAGLSTQPQDDRESNRAVPAPLPRVEINLAEAPRVLRAWPSPPPPRKLEYNVPVVPAESIFDEDLLYLSRVHTVFRPEPSFSSAAPALSKRQPGRLLPSIAIAVAFLTVGYVFSEPLYSKGMATSVAQICGRYLDRTQAWFIHSDQGRPAAPPVQMAEDEGPQPDSSSHRGASRIRVTPVRDPYQAAVTSPATEPAQPQHVENQPASAQQPPASASVRIPESLTTPVQSATMRSVAARITPSILAALEPVELSEDLSRRLLLQKVLPSYPEKAVRARLQGPVVLQAFIARDGTIQDLKLIRGSMLLGQAAYNAVRQWRYQPYVLNGRAVEAQTLVTVDFKLP
ncbi:MAG TPA: TonB family protein [Terriglobales bacterium]|jgi:protein TonB|nr:TonB family protein [Terriglobales bacterium]